MPTKKPRFMITFPSEERLEMAKELAKQFNYRSLNALMMQLLENAIVDLDRPKEKENVTETTRS